MKSPVKQSPPVVFVVDDDLAVRESLDSLIRSVGLRVETFSSAQEFLRHKLPDAPACLVLDIRMPGRSGLDLQHELAAEERTTPIIFITGHGDIAGKCNSINHGRPVAGVQRIGFTRRIAQFEIQIVRVFRRLVAHAMVEEKPTRFDK